MSAPTFTARDELAELVNGGPLPKKSRTVGGIYERRVAYQRADAIIAAGWVKVEPPHRGPLPCLLCGTPQDNGGICQPCRERAA